MLDNIFYDIERIYKRSLKRNYYTLTSLIEAVERYNRPRLWRVIEYVVFFIHYLTYCIHKKYLINYSLGIYQLKLRYILEYKHIPYKILSKTIYPSKSLGLKFIFDIYRCCNEEKCLTFILKKYFSSYNINNLNSDELRRILLFYSREIEFKGDINYFSVAQKIYSYN